jgi:hypothetical protein
MMEPNWCETMQSMKELVKMAVTLRTERHVNHPLSVDRSTRAGRRQLESLMKSTLISIMLLIKAKPGARGNTTPNMVRYPNYMETREREEDGQGRVRGTGGEGRNKEPGSSSPCNLSEDCIPLFEARQGSSSSIA